MSEGYFTTRDMHGEWSISSSSAFKITPSPVSLRVKKLADQWKSFDPLLQKLNSMKDLKWDNKMNLHNHHESSFTNILSEAPIEESKD